MTNRSADDDLRWMRMAIDLAAGGLGRVEPNPMVGCVLVHDGRRIGSGFHQRFGGPHAEVEAIRSLASPHQARGATAYVSLEPCCHHGKTPPCADALIRAGIRRVVIAMRDPFPKVDGGGVTRLREAGIEVDVGVLEQDATELNAAYLKRVRTGRPWVIAKWAMTADGRIATAGGQSKWITGSASRQEVHRLRSRVDAIVVGMGTVIADDPMLDARLIGDDAMPKHPDRVATRVVLCRTRLPAPESKLVRTAGHIPTWVMTSNQHDPTALDRLRAAGVVVFPLASDQPQAMIGEMLDLFGTRQMTNVMVEGGGQLLGSFLDPTDASCQIDEVHVYVGGKLFGGATSPGPIAGPGIPQIDQAPRLKLYDLKRFEDDVFMVYRRR